MIIIIIQLYVYPTRPKLHSILVLPQITFLISLRDKLLTMELIPWYPLHQQPGIIFKETPSKTSLNANLVNSKRSYSKHTLLSIVTNLQLICFSVILPRPYIQPTLRFFIFIFLSIFSFFSLSLPLLLSLSFLHHFFFFLHFWHRYLP